jgi:hypothetical protein
VQEGRALRSLAVYLVACVLVSGCLVRADFPVNVRTGLDQAAPAAAVDANGNFVVVWSSYYDGKSNEIRARLFDNTGEPLTDELQINQTQPGNQKAPAVAMDRSGSFVVVWQGPGDDANDIWCRRFDANGSPDGNEFIVNTDRVDEQVSPAIAMNDSGRHIIVWESNGVPNAGAKAICGRIFHGDGSEVGGELVLSDGNNVCRFPAVALSNDANAVIAWVEDSATQEVRRRLFVADGNAPVYGSVKVNDSPNFDSLTRPSIAMDSAGNFLIAWDGHPTDHDQDDVYIRAFHRTGAWHDQYRVNDGNDGAQRNPLVALYDDGQFLVFWEGDSPEQINKRDIFGQRFTVDFDKTADPVKIGRRFLMNTYLYEDQRNTAACRRDDGSFVAAWQSFGQDGSQEGVFARLGPLVGSADLDGDGFVDFVDYALFAARWAQQAPDSAANLINDNRIDSKDLRSFAEQWLTYRYTCDQANVDGKDGIDFTDFAVLAADWKNHGPLAGDIDKNGTVDEHDLDWLTLHWAADCN